MQRIFKIKTKSNPDPRGQYPSERRYSASIVMGLSVVYLQLFLYSALMGTLIIHKMSMHQPNNDTSDATEIPVNTTQDLSSLENGTEEVRVVVEDSMLRLCDRVEKDLDSGNNTHYYINVPALVCAGCFIMALGSVFSFATGIFAWKQWYIDHNITFFFLSTTFSTLTSAMCLLLTLLTTLSMNFDYNETECSQKSPITFSLAMNIIILSSVGVIWSVLATKLAYQGMRNGYPDDMVTPKSRTVRVSTITKGSKHCSTFPPDIVNHIPVSGKLAKYLPRKDNSDLPKAESNYEYQQRVDKFLSGDAENNENVK